GATTPQTTYVQRVHARLRAVYPRANVVNLGADGATSADVIADQLERAVLLRPRLVTLSVGPNDITAHVPVAEYERNVDTIFRRLARETGAVVVANLLPDLAVTPRAPAVTPRFRGRPTTPEVGELTQRFNEALLRRARPNGIEVVDLYHPSRAEIPQRPELLATDGYHPSDMGHERGAELGGGGGAGRRARLGSGGAAHGSPLNRGASLAVQSHVGRHRGGQEMRFIRVLGL